MPKRYYFHCVKCGKRKPVEQEDRQKIGWCKPCADKHFELWGRITTVPKG